MAKKSRGAYHVKFNAENYDRIGLRFPKGMKEKIMAYCAEHGESLNGMLVRLLETEVRNGG